VSTPPTPVDGEEFFTLAAVEGLSLILSQCSGKKKGPHRCGPCLA